MSRGNRRLERRIIIALLAIGLVGAVPSAALGSVPADRQRAAWQRVCEQVAGGTLSDQPALVCDHLGEPQWSQRRVNQLTRFCLHALGGQPVVRSQYPLELVACLF